MACFSMVLGRANQLQIAPLCCLQQYKELSKRTNLFLQTFVILPRHIILQTGNYCAQNQIQQGLEVELSPSSSLCIVESPHRGGLSSSLWFTRGVKQGCALSPLLFSLYISGLGKVLYFKKEGVVFNDILVTALFSLMI